MGVYKPVKIITAACLILVILGVCSKKKYENMNFSTVNNINLNRYMGKWYEIARFDHSFEKNLVGVTATYQLLENNKIKVVNRGFINNFEGEEKIAYGKAKQPNKVKPGKLKVAFFLFFYADYFILELDKEYQWALVGSSSDKYLWILSRKPYINEYTKQKIVDLAKNRGYNTEKLIWVKQKNNL